MDVPAATPVTTPVEASTVATPSALLLQVWFPEVVLLKVVVALAQSVAVPVMAATAGRALTVMSADDVLVHPLV